MVSLHAVLRTPLRSLLLSAASLAGLVATGVLAHFVPVTRARDTATSVGFVSLNRPRLTPLLDHVAHLCDPLSYALIGLGLIAVALARRRPRIAAAVAFLLVATGGTTHELKALLATPNFDGWLGSGQFTPVAWPSGHATAAMTLGLCGVLVAPRRMRPTAAAVGALFAIAVSYSILTLGWHLPSDVFGGFFVAATWTGLVVAGVLALEQRRPSRARADRPPRPVDEIVPLAISGAAIAAALLIATERHEGAAAFAIGNTTFVVGAAGIAALAVALAAALARGARSA